MHREHVQTAKSPRLILFGIDGGTWDVIAPLVAAGQLPNLGALARRGARGILHSLEPMISPLVWTSIASGKVPDKHGVKDFVVSSRSVRCQRLWDIAAQAGLSVGLTGYLVTWPPEPVNGFVIPGSFAQGPETYPPELSFIRELDMGQRTRTGGAARTYLRFGLQGLRHGIRLRHLLGGAVFVLRHALSRRARDREYLETFYAKRELGLLLYADLFVHLCARWSPDVAILVTSLTDSTSHNFWKFTEPQRYAGTLAPEDVRRHEAKIARAYQVTDRILGRILGLCGPETTVVVLSDHGFQSALDDHAEPVDVIWQIRPEAIVQALEFPESVRVFSLRGRAYFRHRTGDGTGHHAMQQQIARITMASTGRPLFRVTCSESYVEVSLSPENEVTRESTVSLPDGHVVPASEFLVGVGQAVSGVHHPHGILLAAGPGIRRGATIENASVLDVTPTLLYLLGLPVGRDMDGRVLTDLIEPTMLQDRPCAYVDSWEDGSRAPQEDDAVASEALQNHLRGLGYL